MTDYIKRDDAIEAFDPLQRRDWYTPWIVETLKELPSADVAPVRHGKWEAFEDMMLDTCYRCSECGREFYLADCGTPQENEYNYCPNCGARMDGESND